MVSRPTPKRSPPASPGARAALERRAIANAALVLEQLFAYAPSSALRRLADGASLETVAGALSAAAAASPSANPLAGARARAVARREALVAEAGGALAPQAVVERTGMSRQTVNNWRRNGQLIALPRGRRDFVFPACQFLKDRPLAGLDRVLAASAVRHPLGQLEMLLAPSSRMGGQSPLALLRERRVDEAIAVAASAASPLDEAAPARGRRAHLERA